MGARENKCQTSQNDICSQGGFVCNDSLERSKISASDWLEHKFWPIISRDFKLFPKI